MEPLTFPLKYVPYPPWCLPHFHEWHHNTLSYSSKELEVSFYFSLYLFPSLHPSENIIDSSFKISFSLHLFSHQFSHVISISCYQLLTFLLFPLPSPNAFTNLILKCKVNHAITLLNSSMVVRKQSKLFTMPRKSRMTRSLSWPTSPPH